MKYTQSSSAQKVYADRTNSKYICRNGSAEMQLVVELYNFEASCFLCPGTALSFFSSRPAVAIPKLPSCSLNPLTFLDLGAIESLQRPMDVFDERKRETSVANPVVLGG